MSIGPTGGIPASLAGSPLAQTKGSEIERTAQDTVSQQREVRGEERAETAAGIGQTDEDQGASDRDADGRRLWEEGAEAGRARLEEKPPEPPRSKNAAGETGTLLDLSG